MEKNLEKKQAFQALIIADCFGEQFEPIAATTALLPLVNVPLLDYALEALNRSGVEEVFLFCSTNKDKVKRYIRDGIARHRTWSIEMSVQVISSEGCRCYGDALRELDAKGLLRGDFIMMDGDTVTNMHFQRMLEQHKAVCAGDKGAVMTIAYKKIHPMRRGGDEVVIATDRATKRLLFHQRLKTQEKERHFQLPLEMFLLNSELTLHHDLLDPQIAICTPAVLPLFADNFDFNTRDDFIRGLLMNEEILASRMYVYELPEGEYARKVSNWQTYKWTSDDVVGRWVYPLVPESGISLLQQKYSVLRNLVYASKGAQLSRDTRLLGEIVVDKTSVIDAQCELRRTVVGKNCKIGKGCRLSDVILFDGVTIEDQATLELCTVGEGALIGHHSTLSDGTVIGPDCIIPPMSVLANEIVRATPADDFDDHEYAKLAEKAYVQKAAAPRAEDDDEDADEVAPIVKMSKLSCRYEPSDYGSSSEEEQSREHSPIPEDSNIFLSEVIDSLKRGFEEKSNPEFLVLEINSSRYAYNMTLAEVNFNVVKAILSLPLMQREENVLSAFNQLFHYFRPVIKNYLKGEEAMGHCLRAVQECFETNDTLKAKALNFIYNLYDKEVVSEEAILAWYEELEDEQEWLKKTLSPLIEKLQESSEEDDEESDDD